MSNFDKLRSKVKDIVVIHGLVRDLDKAEATLSITDLDVILDKIDELEERIKDLEFPQLT